MLKITKDKKQLTIDIKVSGSTTFDKMFLISMLKAHILLKGHIMFVYCFTSHFCLLFCGSILLLLYGDQNQNQHLLVPNIQG
jgi:hypothetical protein